MATNSRSGLESQDVAHRPVLAVDLDGTLLRPDSLWESFLKLVRDHPNLTLCVPAWLVRGRAFLKQRIAMAVPLDPNALPYNEEVIAFLRRERNAGRDIVLATAADAEVANRIAEHVGLFSTVLASDGRTNLSGTRKRDALVALAGTRGFNYIGNSAADLWVFGSATSAHTVGPASRRRARLSVPARAGRTFDVPHATWQTWMHTLRIHQWVKNVLLFVPLLASHDASPGSLSRVLAAFLAFSLCASGGYLTNDLLDLDADRRHPEKQRRAFAAGLIPLGRGLAAGLLLYVAGFTGAILALPLLFTQMLALYVLLTLWYSTYLKTIPIVDVLVLSTLYTLRVLAGGAAVSVTVSPWLLAFSMFLFVSLAFLKRYAELALLRNQKESYSEGRGYATDDLDLVRAVGPATGYMAVLVLALYINSDKAMILYNRPELLWLPSALLLYWVTRMWFLAHRERMESDPLVFALKDPVSYLVGGFAVLIALLAA